MRPDVLGEVGDRSVIAPGRRLMRGGSEFADRYGLKRVPRVRLANALPGRGNVHEIDARAEVANASAPAWPRTHRTTPGVGAMASSSSARARTDADTFERGAVSSTGARLLGASAARASVGTTVSVTAVP